MEILLICLAVAGVMFTVELLQPGRRWQAVSGWWARAVALNGVQILSVFIAGVTWDVWLTDMRPGWSPETYVGTAGGAVIDYLAITFVYYWWHRARHENMWLWNWFHQVHHSPSRIEIVTSFYKHPFEIFVNSVLSSAILYVMVGLSAEAAAIAVVMTGLAELFYHWNVKTPYWVGFIFQRPESHCHHHKRGAHTQNFSDLPLWDMMFGTFHNPPVFDSQCGFAEGRERKLGSMLVGRNVNGGRK